ncbi:MAG: phosphoenolpyruvate hydrolase family protein [Gemmatimonadota bacterium]
MPFIGYHECVRRLNAQTREGHAIIGVGAGTGISAKFAERGGADIIIIYSSGRFRMAGRASTSGRMPFGDANAIVVDMAREVLPVVRDTPVLAGVCGTDPFRMMRVFLPELKRMGFDGVQNFPTVGLYEGSFRQTLEESEMGLEREVALIAQAHALEMLTCPYVFDEESAIRFTQAGADVIVPHLSTTVGGSTGIRESAVVSLDEAVDRVQAMHDAAKSVNPDVIVLCHGGPIATPADAAYVLERTHGVAGFFGASSIERLATETAIETQARRFKALRLPAR